MQRVASKRWLIILDYIFLLRPMLMPPVWTIGLLGYQQGHHVVEGGMWTEAIIPIAVFSLLTGGVYVQNQIVDIEGDRANDKLFLLADGYITGRAATIQVAICYTGAVLLGFLYAGWLGLLMVVALALGMQYNITPFRWKDRPIPGLLYNVIVYGVIAFAIGWLSVAPFDKSLLLHAIPYCFGVGAVYLNTTLPDIPGDRQSGKITIGVQYGRKYTGRLACVFLMCDILSGFWLGDLFIAVASLAALPLFIRMALTVQISDVTRATKIGVLALSIAAVVVCPFYLVLLVFLFFGAKPYYKHRFGMNYPTFSNRQPVCERGI